MTKYILNSGGIKHYPTRKKKFHQEIVKDLGKKPKILMCNFAQGREYWEVKFPGYCSAVSEDMPDDVTPEFVLAIPDKFVDQCKKADVIYFHGGDEHMLHYWIQQYDIPAVFKGKVVATNSASSDMLATAFWTCDWRACHDGFGILPVKFIPHFKSNFGDDDPRGPINWDKAYKELESYGDKSLPILALEEGEYKIFEI